MIIQKKELSLFLFLRKYNRKNPPVIKIILKTVKEAWKIAIIKLRRKNTHNSFFKEYLSLIILKMIS
jgi:hypothetical protein